MLFGGVLREEKPPKNKINSRLLVLVIPFIINGVLGDLGDFMGHLGDFEVLFGDVLFLVLLTMVF